MAFQFFADYITHRFTAKTRHGTHSPFVYKLIDEVIYDFSAKKPYHTIEQQRKKLWNDHRFLSLNDQKGIPQKTIGSLKQLINNSPTAIKVDQLRYRLVAYHSPANLLQFGTQLGITTAYLALANPQAPITAFESSKQLASLAHTNLSALDIQNVALKVGDTNVLFHQTLANADALNCIYFNDDCNKETFLQYFNLCLTKTTTASFFVIDDIYKNEERKAIWKEVKAHPRVTVTIDLFWIGIVYFKTNQAKEHFKIKFPVPSNQNTWGIKDRWIKP